MCTLPVLLLGKQGAGALAESQKEQLGNQIALAVERSACAHLEETTFLQERGVGGGVQPYLTCRDEPEAGNWGAGGCMQRGRVLSCFQPPPPQMCLLRSDAVARVITRGKVTQRQWE